ncbi:MAG: hypothetical protein AAF799_10485 [Myxococcota bacterium]
MAGLAVLLLHASACLLPAKSAGEDDRATTEGATTSPSAATSEGPGESDGSGSTPLGATSSIASTSDTDTDGSPSCAEALACMVACIETLEFPEPDLSCVLGCERGISQPEALELLQLLECASQACEDEGLCEGSGETDSTDSTSGDPTSASPGEDAVCRDCFLAGLTEDAFDGACAEFQTACG